MSALGKYTKKYKTAKESNIGGNYGLKTSTKVHKDASITEVPPLNPKKKKRPYAC